MRPLGLERVLRGPCEVTAWGVLGPLGFADEIFRGVPERTRRSCAGTLSNELSMREATAEFRGRAGRCRVWGARSQVVPSWKDYQGPGGARLVLFANGSISGECERLKEVLATARRYEAWARGACYQRGESGFKQTGRGSVRRGSRVLPGETREYEQGQESVHVGGSV